MNELKLTIDLKAISDQEIKVKHIALHELWMIKDVNEKILGPYETQQLKEYSHTFDYLFEETQLYNLESEKWVAFFTQPQFQRRKPKIVPSQNLVSSEKDLFVKGRAGAMGPLTEADIHTLLEKGELLSSDLLSVDNKKTWIKLYEHHKFDRRSIQTYEDLPHQPKEDVLKNTEVSVATKDESMAEDAIVGLAFLSHGKDKGHHISTHAPKNDTPPAKPHTTKNKSVNNSKVHKKVKKTNGVFIGAVASFLVGALILGNFWFNHKSKPSISKAAAVPTQGIDNSSRNINTKRAPSSVQPRKKLRRLKPVKRLESTTTRSRRKIRPRRRAVAKEVVTEDYSQEVNNEDEPYQVDDSLGEEQNSRGFSGEYDNLDGEENLQDDYAEDEVVNDYQDDEFLIEERISHEAEDY